jgi:AraC family transcriptional regulator, regulatory protein of adaptative response / methylated-DNA-[protein]-cysteine methyltransferase
VSNNETWRAIRDRDRRLDGQFVWVALSTNIYCRPSCGARRPERHRVLVLSTVAEAERCGYSACRRCHPEAASLSLAELSISGALDYIERHPDEAITLPRLAQAVGFSPHHLQRQFVRIVGISPRDYCDHRRLTRLKQLLKSGVSVSDSAYSAGYGSIRSLYEKGRRSLGMTPATYRRGGAGVRIRYSMVESRLGRVLVADTEIGVCSVLVGPTDSSLLAEITAEVPRATLVPAVIPPLAWTAAVRTCERADPLLSTLPPRIRCDIFRARLMKTLSATRAAQA